MASPPSYLSLYEKGELSERGRSLEQFLEECRLCPRDCGINRFEGKVGYCGAGSVLAVSSSFPHFGEERPLVGHRGSGTIFLTHCNLRCVFRSALWEACQGGELARCGPGGKLIVRMREDDDGFALEHVLVTLEHPEALSVFELAQRVSAVLGMHYGQLRSADRRWTAAWPEVELLAPTGALFTFIAL